jgi:hypothetical protein
MQTTSKTHCAKRWPSMLAGCLAGRSVDAKAAQPSPAFGGEAAYDLLLLPTRMHSMRVLLAVTHHQRQQA